MPPARHRRTAGVLSVGLAAAVLLAGCSNSQSSASRRPHSGSASATLVGGVQQITVQATSTYRFVPSTITVHPGPVRVELVNTGKAGQAAPHNWSLLGLPGAATPLVQAGGSAVITFTAPSPGTYTYVCTIHEKQGQTGTLVVLPG
jgi:plastocyanin